MPIYRLVFPPDAGLSAETSRTAQIDSGDEVYEAGAEIEYDGKRWRVTDAPLEEAMYGAPSDLMVWPLD